MGVLPLLEAHGASAAAQSLLQVQQELQVGAIVSYSYERASNRPELVGSDRRPTHSS